MCHFNGEDSGSASQNSYLAFLKESSLVLKLHIFQEFHKTGELI